MNRIIAFRFSALHSRKSRSLFGLGLGCWLLLGTGPAAAEKNTVPLQLTVDPATIREGADDKVTLKTVVTLQSPSPRFFICQVRSEDRNLISCTDIIFRKGDTVQTGSASFSWSNITADCEIKIAAFNIETPDTISWFTVSLRKKTDDTPEN